MICWVLSVKLVTENAALIRKRLAEAQEKKPHAEHNVAAGREFVAAYSEYVHNVEGLHQAAKGTGSRHEAGCEAASEEHTPKGSALQPSTESRKGPPSASGQP